MKRWSMGFAAVALAMLAGFIVWASLICADEPATTPAATMPQEVPGTIRIAAGRDAKFTDSQKHVWEADRGFEGGSTIDRPDVKVTGTPIPELYTSEHYSMDGFAIDVPNGKYIVKLHFAENYDGNVDPNSRIFTFAVQGHEFKDFSIWKKAGDHFKAYVETVNDVVVKDGKLKITFTAQVENPAISGIEIIPAK